MTERYQFEATPPGKLTVTVVPIEMYCYDVEGNEQNIGSATAFLDSYNGQKYLITNWHCVTWRNPKTRQPLDTRWGNVPSFIRVYLQFVTPTEGEAVRIKASGGAVVDIPVEYGPNSKWIMHQSGWSIDVAAVPIQEIPGFLMRYMSDSVTVFDPAVSVGDQVFILGFPLGIRPVGNFPIWKTGWIASEPKYMAFEEQCYLIDAATRDGMSGSPVVGKLISASVEPKLLGRAPLADDTVFHYEPGYSFLGVYSGRVGVKDALEAQIGKVWFPSTVQEMLVNPRRLESGF